MLYLSKNSYLRIFVNPVPYVLQLLDLGEKSNGEQQGTKNRALRYPES